MVVLYIISVLVGRNFHVLYSCVVIIFVMFRGCSLLWLVVYIFRLWLYIYSGCGCIYIQVVVVYIRVVVGYIHDVVASIHVVVVIFVRWSFLV